MPVGSPTFTSTYFTKQVHHIKVQIRESIPANFIIIVDAPFRHFEAFKHCFQAFIEVYGAIKRVKARMAVLSVLTGGGVEHLPRQAREGGRQEERKWELRGRRGEKEKEKERERAKSVCVALAKAMDSAGYSNQNGSC